MTAAVDYLGIQAMLRPDHLAARDLTHDRQWSYSQLDLAVGQCASILSKQEVEVGERVASLAKNRVELVILHLACARLGAIYVPLNWRLSQPEIQSLIDDVEPHVLFNDEGFEFSGVNSKTFEQLTIDMMHAEPYRAQQIDPDRTSLILFTSGTTGKPKGAMLSERNLEETAIVYSLLGEITCASRFLCDAPMFHIIGLVGNIRPALMNGAAFLVSDKFEAGRSLKRLTEPELAVTHYFCVPQMAAMIRNEPDFSPAKLKGLTALFTGGAPHPAANIREWLNDGIPIADGLGMSEAGTVFRMPLDLKLIDEHAGSVGVATPRLQIRIVDTDGYECPQGETGELQLKGSCVTSGYWRREEESKGAFSEDGWFCTGDIVRMDNDGFYWIVDRCKDMFISGGENVYPAEIEAALAARPDVAESAVVGVQDERWGEVGHLFLVRRSGANLDIETVIADLNTQLARYKIPKHCSVIDSLPRNAAGKIEKDKLRRLIANA